MMVFAVAATLSVAEVTLGVTAAAFRLHIFN